MSERVPVDIARIHAPHAVTATSRDADDLATENAVQCAGPSAVAR